MDENEPKEQYGISGIMANSTLCGDENHLPCPPEIEMANKEISEGDITNSNN